MAALLARRLISSLAPPANENIEPASVLQNDCDVDLILNSIVSEEIAIHCADRSCVPSPAHASLLLH
jgi:hypothetical protein